MFQALFFVILGATIATIAMGIVSINAYNKGFEDGKLSK